MSMTELRVAVFGGSGAGKTVLLSAFFQEQTQPSFQKQHAYSLQAVSKAQGSQLLGRFYSLEEGRFPTGSTRFDDYAFEFFARDLPEPALRVHWYDYPGRWWEDEPEDPEEREMMREAFVKLSASHVGILLADGEKYHREGKAYIKWLLEHFANECERLRRQAAGSSVSVVFPREWIFALSKADLLPPSFTAKEFEREVCEGAGEQLEKLSSVVGAGAFGHRFLLLSSVKADGDSIDPHTSLGLRTLAPAILISTLSSAARDAQVAQSRTVAIPALEAARRLVKLVDSLDDFLPEKYQVVTKLLKAFPVDDVLALKLTKIRGKRDDALRKKDAFGVVLNGMAAALVDDEGARTYHQNQR